MTDPTPPSGTVPGDEQDMTVLLPAGLPPPPAGMTPPQPGELPDDDLGNALPSGTRMGEFELLSMIGEGGFGIVYLAQDHSLGRRVAIKEYMPSSLAARTQAMTVSVRSRRHQETFEAGLRSFMEEARLLARFDHPSLIKVYRFWRANGTAYMVMPYYVGRTLSAVLKAGDAPPDEAWLRTLLAPVLDALEVMHRDSTYHRDIAPDNIMLLEDGRPVVLDLGAARKVISDMTQALTVILKTGYAPIEQYGEMPGVKQGPWTDLYALASVVYYAIRRQTPPQSVTRVVVDKFEPLSTVAAGRYSAGFLAAIDECLAVMPQHRPQSIAQFREMLAVGAPSARAAAAATVVRPSPPSPPSRPLSVPEPVAPAPSDTVGRTSRPAPQDDDADMATVLRPAVAAPVPRPDPMPGPAPAPGSSLRGKYIAAGAALVLAAGGLTWTLAPAPAPLTAPMPAPTATLPPVPVKPADPPAPPAPPPLPPPPAPVATTLPSPAPASEATRPPAPPRPAAPVAAPAPPAAPATAAVKPKPVPAPTPAQKPPRPAPTPPAHAATRTSGEADPDDRPVLAPPGDKDPPVWSSNGKPPKVTRVTPPVPNYVTRVKCNDLLQKQALGDPISAADARYIKNECG